MLKRVIILHGWKGVPEGAWRPWLKKELEKKGFDAVVPQLPNKDNPQVDEWVKYISGVAENPDKDTYFVGHSLGCIAILRYLESLEAGQEIGGAVLVAGFSKNLGTREKDTFFTKPIDWVKIKSHCKNFVSINSDNDPIVPAGEDAVFRENLGAKSIIMHNMLHFCGEEGITELPVALESVVEISNID